MSSKETQALILATALKLFNAQGTGKVSPGRIATACGISKGNLNYHYRHKKDLILDLFLRMVDEIDSHWKDDPVPPSMEQLSFFFFRELRLMWRYRFFYRELVPLLRDDPVLRRRFGDLRRRRTREGQKFLDGLVARGVLRRLGHPDEFALLTSNTWLLTNHWLNFVESTGQMDEQALHRGYLVMLNMIRPYATELGLRDFERLADPRIEVEPA
jgi:AcrR family transcriptional regulator